MKLLFSAICASLLMLPAAMAASTQEPSSAVVTGCSENGCGDGKESCDKSEGDCKGKKSSAITPCGGCAKKADKKCGKCEGECKCKKCDKKCDKEDKLIAGSCDGCKKGCGKKKDGEKEELLLVHCGGCDSKKDDKKEGDCSKKGCGKKEVSLV